MYMALFQKHWLLLTELLESTESGDLFESDEDNNFDDIASETNPLLLNSEKTKTASADIEQQNRWEKLLQKRYFTARMNTTSETLFCC